MGPTKPAGKRLTTALAKLSAALPDERRLPAGRVHFDLGSGDSFLEGLNHAVHMDLCVDIELTRAFDTRITHRAHPLGLVSHDESWHLVWTQADGRIRVDPTGAMSSVRVTRARFDRPADFDLARYWTEHLSTLAASRRNFVVSLRATNQVTPLLQRRFGEDLSRVGQELEVRFDGVIQARSALLPWGGAIEVVAPEALRRTMADHATQALARYGVEDGTEGGQ
jgi:predicted DNA-binding transcriptional regulator YafY